MQNTILYTQEHTSRESLDNPEYLIILTDEEREQVQLLLDELPQDMTVFNVSKELFTQIQLRGLRIPERISEALIRFKRTPNQYGTLVLRNMPTDPKLPDTPSDGFESPDKLSFISEYTLLMAMMYLGEPIGYWDEKFGQLIHDICPVKGSEHLITNTSSKAELTFHTEDAIHPYRPDHVGLVCLRSDHEGTAKTLSGSILLAMKELPSAVIDLLRQPLYHLLPPQAFQIDEFSRIIPILTGSLLEPVMCMNASRMEGITPEAQWAFEKLQEAIRKVSIAQVALPGDIMILDNSLVAHARTIFEARYDGKDRWLQRMFTVTNFRSSSYSRNLTDNICMPLKIELGLGEQRY